MAGQEELGLTRLTKQMLASRTDMPVSRAFSCSAADERTNRALREFAMQEHRREIKASLAQRKSDTSCIRRKGYKRKIKSR